MVNNMTQTAEQNPSLAEHITLGEIAPALRRDFILAATAISAMTDIVENNIVFKDLSTTFRTMLNNQITTRPELKPEYFTESDFTALTKTPYKKTTTVRNRQRSVQTVQTPYQTAKGTLLAKMQEQYLEQGQLFGQKLADTKSNILLSNVLIARLSHIMETAQTSPENHATLAALKNTLDQYKPALETNIQYIEDDLDLCRNQVTDIQKLQLESDLQEINNKADQINQQITELADSEDLDNPQAIFDLFIEAIENEIAIDQALLRTETEKNAPIAHLANDYAKTFCSDEKNKILNTLATAQKALSDHLETLKNSLIYERDVKAELPTLYVGTFEL